MEPQQVRSREGIAPRSSGSTRGHIPLVSALAAAAAWIGLLGSASVARAATIAITSTADDLDAGPNGNCTLREAVIAANTDAAVDGCPAGSGADTIQLPAGIYTLGIQGGGEDAAQTGDLDILGDVTFVGAGAESTVITVAQIGSTRIDRVLHALGAIQVELRDLTIARGGAPFANSTGSGGGVRAEGGASLTVNRSVIRQNRCSSQSWWGTPDSGGGIDQTGGSLRIEASVVFDNDCTSGAGIAIRDGTLEVDGSVVRRNAANPTGGGLQLLGAAHGTVKQSAIVENGAYAYDGPGSFWPSGTGGGIRNEGTLVIEDSTIADNAISWGFSSPLGEGILNSGSIDIRHSTVAGNRIVGLVDEDSSGIYGGAGSLTTFTGSIVGDPCTGTGFVSAGFNVAADATCNLTQPSDLPSADPGVGATPFPWLGSYVLRLVVGSPSIDSGDPLSCPPADQTGSPRPLDGDGNGSAVCDRGAFEMPFGPDSDLDGYRDELDGCPGIADPAQPDGDRDGIGDACDPCDDYDADGWGDPASAECPHPERDCRDFDPAINPDAVEIKDSATDEDCNPATPDCTDIDGDGYPAPSCPYDSEPTDCDDGNAAVNPGHLEIPGDGFDNDCNPATPDEPCSDLDGDGYGNPGNPNCSASALTDCDDTNAAVNPSRPEIPGDGLDNDCNPASPDVPCVDLDHDGYGNPSNPNCPAGSLLDCNDALATVHPGATEIPGDGLDNDCNPATPGACTPQLAEASGGAVQGAARSRLPLSDVAGMALVLSALVRSRPRRPRPHQRPAWRSQCQP